ncbi:MAG: tRNA lysidine(34) synthetase TilS [Clostridiales bacterium]|nr:tRNA lysidine(34) synthetase TilS [Clostridiales bacterium]
MINKVYDTVKKYNMLTPGDRVIVALSGGADSMSLLYALLSLKDKLDITISAAHVNHCLRGKESDGDEMFVRSICEKEGIHLDVLKVDVSAEAAKTGEGTEECGRRIRYRFFESIDPKAKTATAHTLSDDLETMLLNLTRGTALNGLCGIPPVRDNFIRPLIECSRSEIEDFCLKNDIKYVTDSTNAETVYNRNKIRHLVIPTLKEINPSVEEAALRCSEILRDDEEFLNDCAKDLLESSKCESGYSLDIFKNAHRAVRKRAIIMLLRSRMIEKPQKHHADIIDGLLFSEGSLQTAPHVIMTAKNGLLYFEDLSEEIPEWSVDFSLGDVEYPLGKIECGIISENDLDYTQKIYKKYLAQCLDYDKICGNMSFGSRREGDVITQSGGKCSKSLKKLFIEKKIPRSERNGVVVLSDQNGVIWVEGYGCDARVKITDETNNILRIGVIKNDG